MVDDIRMQMHVRCRSIGYRMSCRSYDYNRVRDSFFVSENMHVPTDSSFDFENMHVPKAGSWVVRSVPARTL